MNAEPARPDPDALLAQAQASGRGRMKVFLGMAPGVGKTYAMLAAARRRRDEGGEVLVGVIETHGRRETEALLEGLTVLPRKPIDHRERTLLEFDLDAALAARPALLLVDEYAHANAPGSRHPKRWQDIDELLAAGIDVWTTLNVQHLESLVDVIWKITGVRQRETVPDSALSRADAIELVDITPDELRQRLADGKVYVPETARKAADNFFKPENLTALRELALRRTAQTVDDQLLAAMRQRGLQGPWAAGERILVLARADASASALVRVGRRLSDMMMDAPWTVAFVERPSRNPPDSLGTAKLNEAFKLAEQLGGSAVVLTGDDLVSTVLEYAGQNNITQIVVGKPRRSRWRALFGRALVPALAQRAGGAALHVITTDEAMAQPAPPTASPSQFPWRRTLDFAGAVAMTGLATAIAHLADQFAEGANLAMIFMLSVLITGLAWGLWPALLSSALAAAIYNFLFLDPRMSLVIGKPADILTFGVFFAGALATGWLTGRVRDQAKATARRASAVSALLASSRRLSAAAQRDQAAKTLAEQVGAATGAHALVLLPDGEEIEAVAGAPAIDALSTSDMAAARWTWERGDAAGAGTGTLPTIGWTFWPLQGVKNRVGVVGVAARDRPREDERFLLALLDQGAVALERAQFAADAADAEALRRADRLRSALLNSVSHDLRTPLSTVLGAATTLIDYRKTLKDAVQADLLQSIREEAERLNRYVGNLLDMSRLEGGALTTRREWIDARQVLSAARGRVERRLGRRRIDICFPAKLGRVRADPSLLEQAVVNILENAIAYSADDTGIEMAAYEDRANVVISIEDEGRGIPTHELERVFDRFSRLEEATDRGKNAGLGLAIAKGFVEAMGGRIAAASPIHDGRGTRILISLRKEIKTPEGLW